MILNSVMNLLLAGAVICKNNWLLLSAVFVGYQLYRRQARYMNSPMKLQGVPGPFLAAFTCWYRVYYANIRRNWHEKLVELHEEYGPIVWIAPDEVSVADPKLRGILYGFADDRKDETFFPKCKSFETGTFNDDFNFVFETDPARARLGKYALSHPYSEKGLAKLEHHFDEVRVIMIITRMVAYIPSQAVEEFTEGFKVHVTSNENSHCFSDWTHYFHFDLATLLMAGYSNGLCLAGADAQGAIGALRVIFDVVGSLVPIPFALSVSTKAIRKAILNSQLERLFRWGICFDKGESHKIVSLNTSTRAQISQCSD